MVADRAARVYGASCRPPPRRDTGRGRAGLPCQHALLFVLVLRVQGVEVDRLQQQLRESALQHHVGDHLADERKQEIRAVGAQQVPALVFRETARNEHAGLLHLDQVGGLALVAGGDGQTELHLEHPLLVVQLARLGVQLNVGFALPFLEE
jgi:hypothetical protein